MFVTMRGLIVTLVLALMMASTPSCNSNKIACPTYKDSFPEKKAHKQTSAPKQKISKPKSGVLPPGYKGK